jgi:hypothetical protein
VSCVLRLYRYALFALKKGGDCALQRRLQSQGSLNVQGAPRALL